MDLKYAREAVFKALFQLDFIDNEELAIETAIEGIEDVKPRELRKMLAKVHGTRAHLAEIDKLIDDYLEDWNFSRLGSTDKNILRLAVYEMQFAEKKLPYAIAINEAVNLAKIYGSTDDSGRFVNGVLNAIAKDYAGQTNA